MNKTHFLYLLFTLIFFSCSKKNDVLPRETSGKINTISVIIDDPLWNGEIGDSIRNKFASPVIGLPQEEPLFTINQYPVKLLEGFATDSRTIIVVKKAAKNSFEINKNQYASPQNVFHISGKTSAAIIDTIEKNAPKIVQMIKEMEIAETQKINKQSLINPKIITNKFHITLNIPSIFVYCNYFSTQLENSLTYPTEIILSLFTVYSAKDIIYGSFIKFLKNEVDFLNEYI